MKVDMAGKTQAERRKLLRNLEEHKQDNFQMQV